MLYIICLVIDFVDIYEYLGQKPDLSCCVCSNHDRLGFYADINKKSPYGAQAHLVLWRPPGG